MNLDDLRNFAKNHPHARDVIHEFEHAHVDLPPCCQPAYRARKIAIAQWYDEINLLCKKINPIRGYAGIVCMRVGSVMTIIIDLAPWTVHYAGNYAKMKISRSEFLAGMRKIADEQDQINAAIAELLPQPIAEEIIPHIMLGKKIIALLG